MTIWKFPLEHYDSQIGIPLGGKVIHVGQQDGIPTIWVIVDPLQAAVARRFVVVGTGGDVPTPAGYHGTVQMPGGLVWHVFEVKQ